MSPQITVSQFNFTGETWIIGSRPVSLTLTLVDIVVLGLTSVIAKIACVLVFLRPVIFTLGVSFS